jgi:CheY-like chemotaxis protein
MLDIPMEMEHMPNQAFEEEKQLKKKIMIVDDDIEFRLILSEVLVLQGFTVVTARDGAHALERIKIDRPDLILLDLSMPGLDGWQFCAKKYKDPQMKDIPVVMISGHIISDEKARSNHVMATLTKPFDIFQVLDVVGKVLPVT